jgi:hypothetical protein
MGEIAASGSLQAVGNPARLPPVRTAARMPALMGYRLVSLLLFAVVLGACGKEIGDSCTISTDCDPNGNRICDSLSTDGYCTIAGCDYSSCPDEAACVQFFTGSFSNKACNPAEQPDRCNPQTESCCSLDELCAISNDPLGGNCVPHSSEVRFCMRKCDSDGDCRDGYECRDLQKMKDHGGEPVLAPGVVVDDHAPKFCAMAPVAP